MSLELSFSSVSPFFFFPGSFALEVEIALNMHCTFKIILILFLLYFLAVKDSKKLQQLYCDPYQRLVGDCILMDVNTAVVSDRKGSIAVLSCADYLEGKHC